MEECGFYRLACDDLKDYGRAISLNISKENELMKVHGIMKDGTTACGLEITPELEFWCTQDFKNTTCKICRNFIGKIDSDITIQSKLLTKTNCKVTMLFMENAIKVLQKKGESRFKILKTLGVPHATFTYMKQGKTKISLKRALDIAESCDVSLDQLCGRVNSDGDRIK